MTWRRRQGGEDPPSQFKFLHYSYLMWDPEIVWQWPLKICDFLR
jgi:hypothetical protein